MLLPDGGDGAVGWDDAGGLDATTLLSEAAILPMLIPDFFTGVRAVARRAALRAAGTGRRSAGGRAAGARPVPP